MELERVADIAATGNWNIQTAYKELKKKDWEVVELTKTHCVIDVKPPKGPANIVQWQRRSNSSFRPAVPVQLVPFKGKEWKRVVFYSQAEMYFPSIIYTAYL